MSERPKEADCKSAGLRLRRFKSFSRHVTLRRQGRRASLQSSAHGAHAPLAQSVERFHGKEEVFGSTPEGGSATQVVNRGGVAQLVRALDS